jgi:hypothetical protein
MMAEQQTTSYTESITLSEMCPQSSSSLENLKAELKLGIQVLKHNSETLTVYEWLQSSSSGTPI